MSDSLQKNKWSQIAPDVYEDKPDRIAIILEELSDIKRLLLDLILGVDEDDEVEH